MAYSLRPLTPRKNLVGGGYRAPAGLGKASVSCRRGRLSANGIEADVRCRAGRRSAMSRGQTNVQGWVAGRVGTFGHRGDATNRDGTNAASKRVAANKCNGDGEQRGDPGDAKSAARRPGTGAKCAGLLRRGQPVSELCLPRCLSWRRHPRPPLQLL